MMDRWYDLLALAMVVLALQLVLGFLARGLGRMAWNSVEGMIGRVPVVRNVYSAVKQVTDFIFT